MILILMIQVFLGIYFAEQKEGYHIDEIYTWSLSNYEDGFVTWTEGTVNEWNSGEFYKEVFKVTGEERFNYGLVYSNQEDDVHPPMYYFLIESMKIFL